MGLSQASTDNTEYYLQSYSKYGQEYWSQDGRKAEEVNYATLSQKDVKNPEKHGRL